MSVLKQKEQGTAVTLLSTELNSVPNNTMSSTSSAFTNTQGTSNWDGYQRGKLELYLATYSGTPTAGTGFSVWFLKTLDGTNYEEGVAGNTPARRPDVVLPLRALASGPQRVTVECFVPVGTIKVIAKNDGTGLTFAASGNTLKLLLNTDESV